MNEKIIVGKIEAERGMKAQGYLDVAETATRIIRIPILIINGAKAGKTLGLLGGVHGLEYSSLEAVIRVTQNIDPKELSGAIVAVTCVSDPAFEASGYRLETTGFLSKIDSQNQSRVFISKEKWREKRQERYTMSFRIADKLSTEVFPKFDYMLDCHGGDLPEDIYDYVILVPAGDKMIDNAQRMMAECFNCETVVVGGIEGSAPYFCNRELRIPSITVESGMGYNLHMERANFHYEGIMNLVKRLKMIPGTPKITALPEKTEDFNPLSINIYASHGGLFYPKVGLGTPLSPGQVLAKLQNIFGETIETITWEPPESGRVYKVGTRRVPFPVNAGDQLFNIHGVPEEYAKRFTKRSALACP